MPRLPPLSGSDMIRIFERFGWRIARRRGSHVVLVKEGHSATLSIPDHKEIAKGTMRSLIRSAGLTVQQFLEARS